MKKSIKILLIILAVLVIAGYFGYKQILNIAYKELDKVEVTFTDYESDTKEMRFVGMHHAGKQEFYDNVETVVKNAKADGYVLFYEYIDYDLASDTIARKTKKLSGFIPTPEGYQKVISSIGRGYVAQDNDQFLGLVNDKDVNADVTPEQFINAYEEAFGELILTEEDKNTPIDVAIEPSEPKDRFSEFTLTYRNKYLADLIHKSTDTKIIILYGSAHEEGLFEDLKELNPTWKKVETGSLGSETK